MSSDVPHLPLDVIQDAFAALADEDVVLAPSEDGGYHLVGMRRPHDIFTMVEMSTSTVKDETCAAAHRLGLRLRLLQPDFDVDMPDDLQHLAQHLADDEELRTGHTARQLRMLREPPVKTGWK